MATSFGGMGTGGAAKKAWYQYPSDSPGGSYGQITDPLGPYKKPDVNIAVPAGTPITSLTFGIVTDVSDHGKNGGGLSVVILMQPPLNKLATHAAYNYLGSATVRVGQHVSPGDQIGVAGSKYGINFAIGLTSDNTWGGPTFNLNASGNSQLDPHLLLGGKLPSGVNNVPGIGGLVNFVSGSALGPAFISVSDTTYSILNNVPGFQGICEALDNAETFVPFAMKSTGGQDIGILGHLPFVGQDIQGAANLATLPADAMLAFLSFVTANAIAAIFRTILIYIGISIIITLVRNAIFSRITDVVEHPATQAAARTVLYAS